MPHFSGGGFRPMFCTHKSRYGNMASEVNDSANTGKSDMLTHTKRESLTLHRVGLSMPHDAAFSTAWPRARLLVRERAAF